jgi:hypothetical protein
MMLSGGAAKIKDSEVKEQEGFLLVLEGIQGWSSGRRGVPP